VNAKSATRTISTAVPMQDGCATLTAEPASPYVS
jgi:hypothetical protein